MRYLVCYDIGDDKRRNRLADVLLDFGPRLQESVFLVDLDEELLDRMKERVGRTVDPMVDVVHVFRVLRHVRGESRRISKRTSSS